MRPLNENLRYLIKLFEDPEITSKINEIKERSNEISLKTKLAFSSRIFFKEINECKYLVFLLQRVNS
jgi:hypothetical protein